MENLGRLASQTATHKLGQILGLLVIPIIVLLSIYFLKAKSEIDVLSRQRAGVALAQWVISHSGPLDAQQSLQLQSLESAAGLLANQSYEVVVQHGSEATQNTGLATAYYFDNLVTASRLSLNAEAGSQALADVALQLVPAFENKLGVLAATMTTGRAAESQTLAQPTLFLMATGEVQSVLRRIEDGLNRAGVLKANELVAPMQGFIAASSALDVTAKIFANGAASTTEKQAQLDILHRITQKFSVEQVKQMQAQLLAELDRRLLSRSISLWRNLSVLMLTGLTSAIAGIGLAILMMRSTLLRLDEVELARNDAIAARGEAEGIAVRFASINADISQMNQDMALKVSQLKEAQDELVKKGRMEQLGQLIATIAHEVRNPLGAIRTTAFMIERKISDKGLGLEGHLQRINNSVNRCDTIISQLLDFARTKEVNSSPVLLDDWVAKAVREEAARLPENILIECSLGLDGEMVAIDPVRMQRALVNLLNNAAEALAGQHEREASGSQLSHHIWVSTKRVGEHAVIRIADNGPGIAAEYIKKIREPLYTTKSFGTGLGIPAVEQVVQQHKGRLEISSDIGKGAVFSIHLPMPRRGEQAA
jgi:signal transduction histidine kinase